MDWRVPPPHTPLPDIFFNMYMQEDTPLDPHKDEHSKVHKRTHLRRNCCIQKTICNHTHRHIATSTKSQVCTNKEDLILNSDDIMHTGSPTVIDKNRIYNKHTRMQGGQGSQQLPLDNMTSPHCVFYDVIQTGSPTVIDKNRIYNKHTRMQRRQGSQQLPLDGLSPYLKTQKSHNPCVRRWGLEMNQGFLVLLLLMHLIAKCTVTASLTGTNQYCITGQPVTVPKEVDSPCITCSCQNNIVVCNKEKCPSTEGCFRILSEREQAAMNLKTALVTGRTPLKDTCCRVCKGCHHAGLDYRHGAQWSDGCSHYDCRAGVLTISKKICHVPCDNPLPPAHNGCCQRCQGCWFEGQLVEAGSMVASKSDPCVQCRCSGRTLTCEKRACPVLSCPKSKRHQSSDMCCPVCIGSRELFSPPGGRCFLEHYLYPTGANRTMDHCTTCTCHHGYLTCKKKTCPMLPCSKEYHVEKPGECCPSCSTLAAHGERVCMVHNVIREHGEHWNLDKCITCTCNQGQVTCEAYSCEYFNKPCPPGFKRVESESECCPKCVEAPGVCTVFGDPHYKTFDGMLFNFQGACKYVLARSCRGKDKFNLKVINDARKSSHFSWTKSLSLKIAGAKLTLGQKLRTKVNGKTIKPPFEKPGVVNITKSGHSVTITTPIGLRILWDGESYVEVEVPLSLKGKTCGLCGNFNGNQDDDLKGSDGTVMDTVDQMALSWATGKIRACSRRMNELNRKHEEESPFSILSEESGSYRNELNRKHEEESPFSILSEENGSYRKRPLEVYRRRQQRHHCLGRSSSLRHEKCAALNSTAFNSCNDALPPLKYYQSCLMDMCECKSESRHCECDTIQAYARECARIGTPVDKWRQITHCGGLECPSGAVYKDCAPACRSSCTNITPNPDCYTRRCRPGCYCEPPLVLHRGACILPEECPKRRKRRRRNR